MHIGSLFERYQRILKILPKQLRWLALVFAPAGTSLMVFAAGVLSVAGSLAITAGIGRVSSDSTPALALVWLLVLGFLAESIGFWVKERQETLLTVAVRQLTYRRFREIFKRSTLPQQARENVLTYPGQISQFAYIVDFAVSTVQIVAFLVISLVLYGASGAIAALLIAGLVVVSVKLVKLVGKLWEQYVAFEGERRRWIQRVADALPRGRAIPSWGNALGEISRIRKTEEQLLQKRVRLQVVNGFLERGALTTVLAVVAIVGSWAWPGASFGIAIILAARYLYSAVQNNIVNYRVIRLAVPMMRELDKLEQNLVPPAEDEDLVALPSGSVEVLEASCDRAEALRKSVIASDAAFVPSNPELPQSVLLAWRSCASEQEITQFASLAVDLGLKDGAIERFWRDVTTLSSGERHRAAIALVLVDAPKWLILDDSFAALDPSTREVVARRILELVPACTLLASSEEYVPSVFAPADGKHSDEKLEQREDAPRIAGVEDSEAAGKLEELDLPDPEAKRATFRRSVGLLFGPHVLWVLVGALLLAGSEVAFALILAQADGLSARIAGVSAACALAAVIGSVLFFGTLYRAPIARLGGLHSRIVQRIDRFASPRTSGAVVGRMGEDFSDLQMSVPSALGSVFLVSATTAMLIGGAVAGAPLFIVVVLAVAPLAFLAMRQGSKWILPASTANANNRGEFIGAVGAQAGIHAAPVSPKLRQAGEDAYASSEAAYVGSSVRLTNAYALRTALIQLLVLSLNISAVVLVLLYGNANSVVTSAAVIYFAVTLSSGIQSTVSALQEVGVVSLTAERVQMLEEHELTRSAPAVKSADLKRLEDALGQGVPMVALIGATGVGKSVMLDAVYRQRPEGTVVIVPEVDPFAVEESDLSGVELARSVLSEGTSKLILLDETLKKLAPAAERAEIESLERALEGFGKQAVVVLHSRSNLDCFKAVVSLEA